MRSRFLKHAGQYTLQVMPEVNPKCEDPNCKHRDCIQNKESGDWYQKQKYAYLPTEDELPSALIMAAVKELKAIKSMLAFFTVLAILGILGYIFFFANIFK